MSKHTLRSFALAGAVVFAPALATAFSGGPDDNVAGNPPGRQTCVACHSSFALNSGQGSLRLANLPEAYEPGETYRLAVELADPNARRWGFELTALDDQNRLAGTIRLVNQQTTQLSGGGNRPQFLKHTRNGTAAGQANGASWEFDWTAPQNDIGVVSFYYAGNAANNNGGTSGDRIYAASSNIDAEDPPPPPPPPDSLIVALSPGWNFIGSNVAPAPMALDSLFAEQIEAGIISLIRNAAGETFDPTADENSLTEWNGVEAYQIKTSDGGEAAFRGMFLRPDSMLTLAPGWNWVAYTGADTLHPRQALEAFGDRVSLVKDGYGAFASPEAHVANLRWIVPGSGLMVNIASEEPIEFVWPRPEGGMDLPPPPRPTMHFEPVMNSGRSMNIVVGSLMVEGPTGMDDEIAFTDENGLVVAAGAAMGMEVLLAVWGDDNTTEEADGAPEGGRLNPHYWFAGVDSQITLEYAAPEGGLLFEADTWSSVELRSPLPNDAPLGPDSPFTYKLVGVFPNPFNAQAEVVFETPLKGRALVSVRDLAGRLMESVDAGELPAGRHRVFFEGGALPAGIYLIGVEVNGFKAVSRAVLLK